jgi:dTDP-glucose pyrophosphorylase
MITPYPGFLNLIISPKDSIKTAIGIMNQYGKRIVLIVDKNKLVGVITDGDLRRFLESSVNLESPVASIMNENPITVKSSDVTDLTYSLMRRHAVEAVPIVEENQIIVGLLTNSPNTSRCLFVIMAGGRGKRLLPYTESLPKSLVPIAGKPIIDFILEKASREGMFEVLVSINHMGNQIREHCASGSKWGLEISYISEERPLGTCGSLSLLENSKGLPVMVTNSDVIFPESFSSMLDFHLAHEADITIAGVPRVDVGKYGELVLNGMEVKEVREKPTHSYQILGGVYCFSPKALMRLQIGVPMDMPEFLNVSISDGLNVKLWTVSSNWWDIGQEADLLSAERWIRENNYGAD